MNTKNNDPGNFWNNGFKVKTLRMI